VCHLKRTDGWIREEDDGEGRVAVLTDEAPAKSRVDASGGLRPERVNKEFAL